MGGASSRSVFADGFADLISKDIDPSEHKFWDDLWKATLTIEEVFELITPENVRKLIQERPGNLRTLFTQGVVQLYQVVETPFPQYFEQALNCIRILSRMIPVMLETNHKEVHELLWSRSKTEQPLDDGAAHGGERKEEAEVQEAEPMAVILINTLYHLLFLPEFSIDEPDVEFNETDVNTQEFKSALMWAVGVGSAEKTVSNATQFDGNRADLLRLMIAILCDTLYQSPEEYDSCSSMWLEVATSAEAPYAEIAFYSLMNTVLGYDPIGWGVPYSNLMSTDTAKSVMESAIQVLIVLLDYGHPIKYRSAAAAAAAGGAAPDAGAEAAANELPFVLPDEVDVRGFNVYRRFLGNIRNKDQLNFMYRGFLRLLNNAHQADSTYLPYSITKIGIEQELLILFWKCLEECPKFMPYILAQSDMTELLVPICYFMLEGRKDPAKVGLMYLCTFTLLKLSGDRSFGVMLNKPYHLSLPVDIPLFSGNHADLLIIVLHKLIVSGSDRLASLYNCFLTIICNVSPYLKTICSASAVKIVNMFQLFSSPAFFFAAENNYTYVMLLLETINNIVQYQYEGHSCLIYAIIRRREVFEKLMNISMFNTGFEGSGGVKRNKVKKTTAAAAAASAEEQLNKSKKGGKASKQAHAGQLDVQSSKGQTPDRTEAAAAAMLLSPSPGSKADDEAEDDGEEDATPEEQVLAEKMSQAVSNTEMVTTLAMERRVNADGVGIQDVLTPPTSPKRGGKDVAADVTTDAAIDASGNGETVFKTVESAAESVSTTAAATEQTSSAAAAAATPKYFVPTGEWLEMVKSSLPLSTVNRLLKNLVPQIEALIASDESAGGTTTDGILAMDEARMLEFIQTTTMVGLLPVPHPIVIRKYQPNKYTSLWFTAFEWGVIFMHNQQLPLFDGGKIRLFAVQTVEEE